MMSLFSDLVQRAKWDRLAQSKPWYYIWSSLPEHDEEQYRRAGREDVERYITNDPVLTDAVALSEANVLEVGCGNGRMSEFLAPQVKHLYAIDISPTMIALAKERLATLPNATFLTGSGSKYPVADASVDIVFSYIVFQHFPTHQMIADNLAEVMRVLRDGGVAKIQVRGIPASGGWLRFVKWYYGVSVTRTQLAEILGTLGAKPIAWSGEGTKELWVTFLKEGTLRAH